MKIYSISVIFVATFLWNTAHAQMSFLPKDTSTIGVEIGYELQSDLTGLNAALFYSYKNRIVAKLYYSKYKAEYETYEIFCPVGPYGPAYSHSINPELQINIIQPESLRKVGLYSSTGVRYYRTISEYLNYDQYYLNAHVFTKLRLGPNLTLVPEFFSGLGYQNYLDWRKVSFLGLGGNLTLNWHKGPYLKIGLQNGLRQFQNGSRLQGNVKIGYNF